jgi:hypothetical protein
MNYVEQAEKVAAKQAEQVDAVVIWSENFAVLTDAHFKQADRALGRMAEIKKDIETERDKIGVPARAAWKAALAFFNPFIDRVEKSMRRTKSQMDVYRKKIRDEAAEEERRRQEILDKERAAKQKEIDDAEAAAKATQAEDAAQAELLRQEAKEKQRALDMATDVVEAIEAEVPETENTTPRKVWKYEIEDEGLIPHDFRKCEPDTGKIRKHMNEYRERANVPGVRFFEEEDTALVGRRGR